MPLAVLMPADCCTMHALGVRSRPQGRLTCQPGIPAASDWAHCCMQNPQAAGFGGRAFEVSDLESDSVYCLLSSPYHQVR